MTEPRELLSPPNMEMIRFGTAVERIDERMPGVDLPLMSVSQTRGVVRRSELTDKEPRADSLDVYKVCRRNDIVFNKMSVGVGAMGVAGEDGLVTYHYEVMRPRSATDPRFIVYLMKSAWFTGEMLARERGIAAGSSGGGVRTTEIPFSVLRTIDAPIPNSENQRRIADFLDDQVARIDEITRLREGQIRALRAYEEGWLSEQFELLVRQQGPVRMRHLLVSIRQGWSPQAEDRLPGPGEWSVLKAGCVNGGTWRPDELKTLPDALEPRREFMVKSGDLLINRASGSLDLIGSAAVVDQVRDRVLLCDKVYRVQTRRSVEPKFIALMWRTRQVREVLKLGVSGAEGMANSLPGGIIRSVLMPAVALQDQVRWSEEASAIGEQVNSAVEQMQAEIELLQERKRSLITAAVTGEFDVTTASGRGVA